MSSLRLRPDTQTLLSLSIWYSDMKTVRHEGRMKTTMTRTSLLMLTFYGTWVEFWFIHFVLLALIVSIVLAYGLEFVKLMGQELNKNNNEQPRDDTNNGIPCSLSCSFSSDFCSLFCHHGTAHIQVLQKAETLYMYRAVRLWTFKHGIIEHVMCRFGDSEPTTTHPIPRTRALRKINFAK